MSAPTAIESAAPPVSPPLDDQKYDEKHIEHSSPVADDNGTLVEGPHNAGMAVIEQREVIPKTGKRLVTGKWEYITFTIYYFANNGAPIGGNGGALRQLLVSQQFPLQPGQTVQQVQWGGKMLPLNSMLLDVQGIMFAAQMVTLLMIGPYADYGNWRPWILIGSQVTLWIMQFAMCGMRRPDQWQSAQALFVLGNLAANISTSFYQATFPSLVRDLKELIQSEHDVKTGVKSPEEHAKLDQYERAQLYNRCNIVGSALVVFAYSISVGISAGVGFADNEALIRSYRILMGYFGAVTVITTVPFLIIQKHRPGQQLPAGSSFFTAGPKQVWSAMKSARRLKHCILYLIAWCILQESWGTWYNIVGILQNEVIHYSPLKLNAMSLLADLAGGSGTVVMFLLQKRFRFSVKAAVRFGACMTVPPCLWGGIGMFTGAIGFHHTWEFWVAQCWNFMTASWGAYSVTMVSEVVPAPKAMMFFALFNTFGKTSGFIGPFITAAIIERAGGNTNAAFWFIFALGCLGVFVIFQVDPEQAKIDNALFLEREAAELYSAEQRAVGKEIIESDDQEFNATVKDV